EMTGYAKEELVGQSARILYPTQEDFDFVGQEKYRQIAQGGTGQVETCWRKIDGSIIDVLLASTPIDLADLSKGVTFTALDITERKQAERVLRESEDKFRKAFMTSPDSVNINRLQDGMYISINPGFTQIMGYTEADVIGKTSLELSIWENPEERARLVEGLRKDGFVSNLEARFRRKDGVTRYGLMSASVIELGGVPHILSITRDITERKQAEEIIHQSERQMKALVTSLDDIVFEFDEDGTYLNIWTADENLLARPKSQMLGKQVFEVMGREQGASFYEAIKRVLAAGVPETVEYPLDVVGGQRWFMARVSPILAPDGSRRTASILIRDITGRKQVEEQVQVQLQRMRALNEIDRAISSGLDMRLSLDILLDQALSQLGVDAACVLLLDSSSQALEYAIGKGFRLTSIRRSRVLLGQEFAGQAGLERRLIHVADLNSAGSQFLRGELLKGEEFVEYFGVPLIAKGMLKGVLEIFHRSHLDPDLEWMNYLETLGGQAAIAIDNAQLFERMERSNMELIAAYDATIEGWSHAMDLRDKETEGHTQRVTKWTEELAKRMSISRQEIVHMRRGALLHDIGKLGVPDHILNKPDKLDEAEWAIMRQHPNHAFDMLMSIHYLRPSLDIPCCHHEKWDGSGYPRQLKGEEIPLAARIFAVVDVWDAMRSDRPYRTSWPADKVRELVIEQSGRHFDPQVVEAFLSLMEESPDLF
ncbi:partial Cyclic di-GMP phosphodiesterase, partial [Anaerolineales bacterium]